MSNNVKKHDSVSPIKQKAIDEPVKPAKDSTINLSEGFVIKLNIGESKEVNNMSLFHNGKPIDLGKNDSTGYIIDDKMYPMVNKIDPNTYELFFEEAENPNKNLLKFYRVRNDLIEIKKDLPTFIAKPADLDDDGVLELAGMWDYSEEVGEGSDQSRTVDPILYYKLTKEGIKLDSALTKERNTFIYGKFYGFKYDGKTTVPVKLGCNQRMDGELKRITNKAK